MVTAPLGAGEAVAARLARLVDAALPRARRSPLVLGLCGAQGSGKTTAAIQLARELRNRRRRTAVLSLDDFYLPRADREAVAGVHPLLRLRGVPGTHDPGLGLALLTALGAPGEVRPPRFDKARDERFDPCVWDAITAPVDVIIFEGWCVGARPQTAAALAPPVNALEREEDVDGRWRAFVNDRLAGDYQTLFARIDILVLLAAPDFSVVAGWRREQEEALRARLLARGERADGCMSAAAIDRFVLTYQRLTEHILQEMPARADLVLRLDGARRLIG